MDSDERLYERLRGGDMAAFDALYARYERRLFGFVRAYLHDAHEAEDVFHEAFISVLKSGDISFERGSFKSWLYQIARNACLNRLRSRKRGESARDKVRAAPEEKVESAEEKLERRAATAALDAAVRRLPAQLSELYHLRISGMSYEDMARVLAMPLGTVKSRMHEMVSQLREEMKPWTAR